RGVRAQPGDGGGDGVDDDLAAAGRSAVQPGVGAAYRPAVRAIRHDDPGDMPVPRHAELATAARYRVHHVPGRIAERDRPCDDLGEDAGNGLAVVGAV